MLLSRAPLLWSFIYDIGYLWIFAIAQKSKEPNDLFYMDIFLGSALLQDQIFFDQDTSLDDCSQSGHLRVEKLPWPTKNDSSESDGLWEHFFVLTLAMSNNQLRDLNMLF